MSLLIEPWSAVPLQLSMCVLVHRPFGISCWNETVVLPLTYLKLSEISSIANCVLFMFCGLYLEKFYWHVIFFTEIYEPEWFKKDV